MTENPLFNSPRLLQALSLPPVLLRLIREAVSPEPDCNVLAETARLDPALAATMLHLVNSAFYGLPQKVTDLGRAVAVLGTRELLKLAVAMTLQKDMAQGAADCGYDFVPDWRLIVWSSIAAELIAGRLCPRQADQAYLCSLFKDISLLFLRRADKKMLVDLGRGGVLTVLAPRQLERERKAWGMDHGALSQMLLRRWGIPAVMGPAVRRHHALEEFADEEPLTQAVILATRWSELALGHAGDPMCVVQFSMLLRGLLDMSEREIETLHGQCTERFRSMLQSLGISEGDRNGAYYGHSVAAMQRYCFLGMDLPAAEGGLRGVARILDRHVRLNWDARNLEVALKVPHGGRYALFHVTPKEGLVQETEFFDFDFLPWRIKGGGLEIAAGGLRLGELRLESVSLPAEERGNLELYLRFFAQGYAQYCARQAVLEAKARVFDTVPIGVARLDGAGLVVEANPRFAESLGLAEPAKGKSFFDLLGRLLPRGAVDEFSAFLADAGRQHFGRIEYVPPGGAAGGREGALYLSLHRDVDGPGSVALIEDLHELSGAEAEMLRRKSFLERLVTSMRELVITVGAGGSVEFSSRPDLGLRGRRFSEIFAPLPGGEAWADPPADPPCSPVEVLLHTPGGVDLPYELTFAPLGASESEPVSECLVVGRNLTQVRRLEAEVRKRALFDALTGLFNHYQFRLTLEREVARSRRTGRGLGLIFFDLDHFKAVNDAQGHLAGDAVLKAIGSILQDELRRGMDSAGRYGGDEFALIVTEVDEACLHGVAERLLATVREKFKGRLSASMGCSMLGSEDTAEGLLRRVDEFSYEAKRAGGDTLVGPSAMTGPESRP